MDTNQMEKKEVPFRVHYKNASQKTDLFFKTQTNASNKTIKLAIVLLEVWQNNNNNIQINFFL